MKQTTREAAKNIKRLLERIQVNKHKYTSRPHYDKFIKEVNKNSVQHFVNVKLRNKFWILIDFLYRKMKSDRNTKWKNKFISTQ